MIDASETRILSSRINLVPFGEEYLTPQYVAWLNDPDVVKYSENRHCVHTLESCRNYWRSMEMAGNFFWAIEWTEGEGQHIGNITATMDINNKLAELSILIGQPEARGRGLGQEAWDAAMEWLLSMETARKVHAGTMATNVAMIKIFKRSGMEIECRRIAHYLLDGRPVDLIFAGKFSRSPQK